MKFKSGSKRLRLYILCLAAFLLFVALVLPRHKSCYEIASPQLRKVVCGTLSQYANANLYRVDGMAYEEIPAGWT